MDPKSALRPLLPFLQTLSAEVHPESSPAQLLHQGKQALWTLVLGVLVPLGSCGLLASDPPEVSSTPEATAEPTPNLVYEDFTLTEVKPNGQPLWQLQASFARYEQEGALGNATLDRVQGELYDSEDRPIRIQAQTGAVYPEEPRLELRDEVEVESGFYRVHLEADQVNWLPDSEQLLAEGNVVIRTLPDPSTDGRELEPAESTGTPLSGLEAKADQLTFDLSENQLRLTQRETQDRVEVTAVSPPLDLQALLVEWDLETQQLTAEGEVNGFHRSQQVQLTGDRLISPLNTPQVAVVGRAEAVGLETQQQIKADQLIWDTATPVIEAEGNVFYRQPGQELSLQGTSGTLNWETRTAAVQGSSTTQVVIP